MPTDTADPPSAWNSTERSRAQTRALLTALARNRSRHLVPRVLPELATAAVTLTILPLIGMWQRLVASERAMWSQLEEFAVWRERFSPSNAAEPSLAKWARHWRETASSRATSAAVSLSIAAAICFCGYGYLVLQGQHPHVAAKLFTGDAAWRTALMLTGAGWLLTLFIVIVRRWHLRGWLDALNQSISTDGKRPLVIPSYTGADEVASIFGIVLISLQAVTEWPIALAIALFALIAGFVRVRAERKINLQLVERLLEWMDDSGLPVEYEVTALNPDEIAAMIG